MNKKKISYILTISLIVFIGCVNPETPKSKNTQLNYVVGDISAAHKLTYVDYDRRLGIKREITFYINELSGRHEFNLCEMEQKYIHDRSEIRRKNDIKALEHFNVGCKSYLELIDNKQSVMIRYSFSWYSYFKDGGNHKKVPVLYTRSRPSGGLELDMNKIFTVERQSYWKWLY